MAKTTDLTIRVEGMHCAGCVASIERGVSDMKGIARCRVNLALKSAVVMPSM